MDTCDSLETFRHVVIYPTVAQLNRRKIGLVSSLRKQPSSEKKRLFSQAIYLPVVSDRIQTNLLKPVVLVDSETILENNGKLDSFLLLLFFFQKDFFNIG